MASCRRKNGLTPNSTRRRAVFKGRRAVTDRGGAGRGTRGATSCGRLRITGRHGLTFYGGAVGCCTASTRCWPTPLATATEPFITTLSLSRGCRASSRYAASRPATGLSREVTLVGRRSARTLYRAKTMVSVNRFCVSGCRNYNPVRSC